MEAEVSTLPNYEIDILFPPGPAGILLEPVVRCGNRSIGARVVGFADNAADEDFYLKSPISDPASPSVNVHTLAAENVSLGAVLMQLDFVSTQHLSFDRIMVSPNIELSPLFQFLGTVCSLTYRFALSLRSPEDLTEGKFQHESAHALQGREVFVDAFCHAWLAFLGGDLKTRLLFFLCHLVLFKPCGNSRFNLASYDSFIIDNNIPLFESLT